MVDDSPLVAVIDDEESVRRALSRLLRSARYRAESFGSGALFLESLAYRVPSCVILDLQMPAMTGLDLQEELQKFAAPPPVIVITAHDEPGTREQCLALGARYYFSQPIDGSKLIESVRSVVGTE